MYWEGPPSSSKPAPSRPSPPPRRKPRCPPPRGSWAFGRMPRPPEVRSERRDPSDVNRTLGVSSRKESEYSRYCRLRWAGGRVCHGLFAPQRCASERPTSFWSFWGGGPVSADCRPDSRAAVYPLSHAVDASEGLFRCSSGTASPEWKAWKPSSQAE